MTDLLKKAIEAVSALPENDQDRIAEMILVESYPRNADEDRWEWIGGRRPTPEEVRHAVEGIKALSKTLTLGGISIRELIEEGRV